ncbi:MAG: hypothetical protein UZ14_CFX002000111 [Chloroflexi bacterium OLB14]|nr:MAG: hypothetical protein UZ14_CFX002000111 [Chloroflexi bacterium OLB14]
MLVTPAHADVAPPESPPGSNIDGNSESTQVRMVAETVTLTISEYPADKAIAMAKTEAVFTMRNLGTVEEKMNVRFPLSFFNGDSDGFGNFPEIKSIEVKINGETVPTRKEIQLRYDSEYSYDEREEIPWAVFEAVFPPNQDVIIEVVYNVQGFGYYPNQAFKYVLETGAGWKGTIGSAEIILRLPYEANKKNVWVEEVSGYTEPTSGGVFSGNEVRWKFEDLEPTYESNVLFVVVTPSLWKKVLTETENTSKNPNDGEAWGRLGKAYKEVILAPKGWLRGDASGVEMFELSRTAYEKSLSLLPNDPLWHYGYAELLWSHYYYSVYWPGEPDTQNELPALLRSLEIALKLKPDLQEAKELLDFISAMIPEAVQENEDGSFTMLGLTATPPPPTPWGGYLTPTALPTLTVQPVTVPTVTASPAPSEPTTSNPLCGSAAMILLAFGIVTSFKRKVN